MEIALYMIQNALRDAETTRVVKHDMWQEPTRLTLSQPEISHFSVSPHYICHVKISGLKKSALLFQMQIALR